MKITNVGEKIKVSARIILVIGILMSFASCTILQGDNLVPLLDVILIIGGGSFLSWVISIIIYGFGQLVDNLDKLVDIHKQ